MIVVKCIFLAFKCTIECVASGWGGFSGGDRVRGEQGSDLGPSEAAAAWYGLVQSGAAYLHPGATLFPRQTVRLLLPRQSALTVSISASLSRLRSFLSCSDVLRCPLTVLICCVLCPRAVQEESAYGRIKQVLRWYLSGFYKKPKVNMMCITAIPRDFLLAPWPQT